MRRATYTLPYVQQFLLQRGQCVRVINPYPDHRSVADALADSYDLGVGVLVSVDKLLELKGRNIIERLSLSFSLSAFSPIDRSRTKSRRQTEKSASARYFDEIDLGDLSSCVYAIYFTKRSYFNRNTLFTARRPGKARMTYCSERSGSVATNIRLSNVNELRTPVLYIPVHAHALACAYSRRIIIIPSPRYTGSIINCSNAGRQRTDCSRTVRN